MLEEEGQLRRVDGKSTFLYIIRKEYGTKWSTCVGGNITLPALFEKVYNQNHFCKVD